MLQEAHARISAAEAARGTQAAAAQQRGAPRGGPPAPVGQHGQGAASGSGGCGGSGACGSSGSGKTLGKPGVNSNPERRKELKVRTLGVKVAACSHAVTDKGNMRLLLARRQHDGIAPPSLSPHTQARMAEVQKQLEQERAACKALRSGTAAAAAKGAAGGADVQD